MRCSIISGLTFAAVLIMNGCASGDAALMECYSSKQFTRMIAPAFSCYVMNVAASEQSRIDLYMQMPYKKIRFQKESSHYSASYSYTFLIRDEKKEIVQSKDVDRSVAVGSYEESVSLRFDPYLQTFLLVPGIYMLEIQCRDNLSQLVYRTVYKLDARNFQNPSSSASSVLLLDTISHDEKGFSLRPILPDNVSFLAGSLGTFQEIYNVHAGDSLTIMTHYSNVNRDSTDDNFSYLMPPYRLKHPACNEATDTTYFSAESVFVASKEGTVQFIQSHPLPRTGFSSLRRIVIIRSSLRIDTLVSTLSLYRRDPQYKILPSTDEILFTMRYITKNEEYDSLKNSDSEMQKKKMAEFWDDHGGSQRKYDFERRITEANRLFTSCVDGSRTPMGIVYTICGIPDFIDCRGAYIENWYYTVGERTYVVQFREVNDGGDHTYFELTPFSINDSFWQYQIDRWRRKN
ncbi:MAG: GWxTD domain-containing protein [Ignavibacteriales bacterium]|nr:GWxTD domain-containing protein [Ignavibacteriales bacterium]